MKTYTRREWIIVLVLSLSTFTGILNLYLLTPFLKLVASEFHVSESAAGQLSTAYTVAAGVIGLLAAPLMDRYQRGRILQVGLLIVALGTILSAVAWSFPALLIARAGAGLGAAVVSGCNMAAASDAFPNLDKRNRCVGILISATGFAGVIGMPILTHIASYASWRWAVASLLVLVVMVIAGVSLLPRRELNARQPLLADYAARYRQVLHHTEATYLLLASLIRNIIWTAPLIYSVAIFIGLFHLSLAGYGWVFMIAGIYYFVASNLAPQAVRRTSARRVFVASTLVQLAGALAFSLALGHLVLAILFFCGLFFAAGAFAAVAMNILLQDSVPESRGAVLSLATTTQQAGSALGGMVGGVVLAELSAGALLPVISLLTPIVLFAIWRSDGKQGLVSEVELLEPAA